MDFGRFSLVIWVATNVTSPSSLVSKWCYPSIKQHDTVYHANGRISNLASCESDFECVFSPWIFDHFLQNDFLARPHPPPTPAHTTKQWLSQSLKTSPSPLPSFASCAIQSYQWDSPESHAPVPSSSPISIHPVMDPWVDPTARPRLFPPGFGAAQSRRRETV